MFWAVPIVLRELSMKKKEIALEDRATAGERLFSPSAARNRDVIGSVLIKYMPATGVILEVGSGTGEHAVHMAQLLPGVRWLPGDPDPDSRASIAAWTAHAGLENVSPPHSIDVSGNRWDGIQDGECSGIVSINMIHIAPFSAARGLIAGAGRYLKQGGALFLYGPFSRNGQHTAPSNEDFDASLKSRDAAWGVRDLENDLLPLAYDAGLKVEAVVDMPANNLSVILRKS